jgi:hypothetical protein
VLLLLSMVLRELVLALALVLESSSSTPGLGFRFVHDRPNMIFGFRFL